METFECVFFCWEFALKVGPTMDSRKFPPIWYAARRGTLTMTGMTEERMEINLKHRNPQVTEWLICLRAVWTFPKGTDISWKRARMKKTMRWHVENRILWVDFHAALFHEEQRPFRDVSFPQHWLLAGNLNNSNRPWLWMHIRSERKRNTLGVKTSWSVLLWREYSWLL